MAGAAHAVGWPALARTAGGISTLIAWRRSAACPKRTIAELARLYAGTRPGMIKIADGLQRNLNGGQTTRAICALPALTGQYGTVGGGLSYSASGVLSWNSAAVNHWAECPPPARKVNMNRLGAALLGEVAIRRFKSLYVFGSNPAAIAPNAARVIAGLTAGRSIYRRA